MSDNCFIQLPGSSTSGVVTVCDHAANTVPEEIDLGVNGDVLSRHVAWDIGTAGVVERMARRYHIPAHMAVYSRLLIDLHREEDSAGLIPATSDGHLIPGNIGADREGRLEKYYRPYHDGLAKWLDAHDPKLILSIHSFTPKLEHDPDDRPWEVALLYNQDDRAAQHAIRLFKAQGLNVGENEPYSGKQLNATMNRHAEAFGRPYCAIEIRNDLISDPSGQARWAALLAELSPLIVDAMKN